MDFIDGLLAAGDGRPTVIVLDNASIHHGIDAELAELLRGYGSAFQTNFS
ncbi:hypothetical protein [Burkholderia ubonensis]|nr:hypothetical protein [Burkholderia ubonensis]